MASNPFGTFGASAAAPTAGGFGFGAQAPSQSAPTNGAPAAGGFGGFGFGGAAPADGAKPAAPAAGGFGFGGAAPAAPADGAKPAAPAGGGFGFGGAAPADGAKPAAPAAGGFGFGGAAPAAPADGAKAAAPAAGGFGFGGAAPAAPAVPAAAPSSQPGASPSQEFAGKTLSSVLGKLDMYVASDQRHFAELAQHVVARDRHIMARGRDLMELQSIVKDALTAAKSAEATLSECKQRQAAQSDYLQSLEDKVQPHYKRWEDQQQQQQQQHDGRGVDQQRLIAYDSVMTLLEEVQGVEEKVSRAVRQHNHARSELLGRSEVEGTMRMIDGQLLALQCCSTLATALEQELDCLLGKGE